MEGKVSQREKAVSYPKMVVRPPDVHAGSIIEGAKRIGFQMSG